MAVVLDAARAGLLVDRVHGMVANERRRRDTQERVDKQKRAVATGLVGSYHRQRISSAYKCDHSSGPEAARTATHDQKYEQDGRLVSCDLVGVGAARSRVARQSPRASPWLGDLAQAELSRQSPKERGLRESMKLTAKQFAAQDLPSCQPQRVPPSWASRQVSEWNMKTCKSIYRGALIGNDKIRAPRAGETLDLRQTPSKTSMNPEEFRETRPLTGPELAEMVTDDQRYFAPETVFRVGEKPASPPEEPEEQMAICPYCQTRHWPWCRILPCVYCKGLFPLDELPGHIAVCWKVDRSKPEPAPVEQARPTFQVTQTGRVHETEHKSGSLTLLELEYRTRTVTPCDS